MNIEIQNVLMVSDESGFTYYLGTIKPTQIKELTFVPVVVKSHEATKPEGLNEQDTAGYQRAGEPSRMETIKNFVQKNPRCVIPPVLLSARGKWEFKPSSSSKTFGKLVAEDLAAIIDGQHRLGGLWRLCQDSSSDNALKQRSIPFMMIADMEIEEERRNFIEINDNQKGVKKSLLKYLVKNQDFIGQAANALMEDEDSPFKGRIAIQRKEDWHLLLFGAMSECVSLLFSRQVINTLGIKPGKDEAETTKCMSIVIEYWNTVADCWSTYWADMDLMPAVGVGKTKDQGTRKFNFRLLEETGIRAVSRLGADLLKKHWMKDQAAPDFEGIKKDLEALREKSEVRLALTKPTMDPTVLEKYPDLKSTGKAGVQAIYDILQTEFVRL